MASVGAVWSNRKSKRRPKNKVRIAGKYVEKPNLIGIRAPVGIFTVWFLF